MHGILFQHFGINEVVEVGIVLESLNLGQSFLAECYPVGVHVIGLPLGGVLVAVGYKATVVPLLIDTLNTQEELACHLLIDLVSQFNFLDMVVTGGQHEKPVQPCRREQQLKTFISDQCRKNLALEYRIIDVNTLL